MIISFENIGQIKKASISLNGLTVIAGENDTGKSTISKILFAIIKSLNSTTLNSQKIEIKRKSIINIINQKRFELRDNIEKNEVNNLNNDIIKLYRVISSGKFLIRISKLSRLELRGREEISSELMKLKAFIITVIDKSDLEENITNNMSYKEITKRIQELGINELFSELEMELSKNIPKEELIKISLNKYLISLFSQDINNKFVNDVAHIIIEDMNEIILKVEIKDNKITKCIYKRDLELETDDATFIESPSILQYASMISKARTLLDSSTSAVVEDKAIVSVHLKDLYNKLSSPFLNLDYNLLNDDSEIDILGNIADTINGSIEFNQNDNSFIYKTGDKVINIINTASGIKSFGIIQMLLQKGFLNSNSVLILDEPEINEHPKWQIIYAKLLVDLAKHFKVNVILTSHSPYFIEAIKIYSDTQDFLSYTDFYITQKQSDNNTSNLIDATNNLNMIFEQLTQPLDVLTKASVQDILDDLEDI